MIGLIAAMPQEIDAITARMENLSTDKVADVEFRTGTLGNEKLVIALSGVGKVHAAIAATLMCQLYQPECLISIGVAGGLRDEQEVGDLVISNEAIQADFDTSFIDGPEGIGKVFKTDAGLIDRAEKAAEKHGIPYRVGAVATQDLFMAHPDDYAKLMKNFPQAACSEMEGGAVAQVADAFELPFVILRTLSDVVVHEDNPVEFSTFSMASSKKAASLLETFCSL